MMNLLKRLYRDEEGQALAEYGLILALVAVAVIITLTALGGAISNLFENLTENIATTTP
jgi:pilus assembly protein Flp/PilA